jgi:hypothetical protein
MFGGSFGLHYPMIGTATTRIIDPDSCPVVLRNTFCAHRPGPPREIVILLHLTGLESETNTAPVAAKSFRYLHYRAWATMPRELACPVVPTRGIAVAIG